MYFLLRDAYAVHILSGIFAMIQYLSVCHKLVFYRNEIFSTYPILCYKEIRVDLSPKLRVLSSGTLSQPLNFAN